ncbi:hypothetical protein HZA39_00875, partial [Candidatus Peregrinibacteria bacterium]|nr:hypothetical protein [Candidatus Peregrinibacteria bacterium]
MTKKHCIIIAVLVIIGLIAGLTALWPTTGYTKEPTIINPDEIFTADMKLDEVREAYHKAINSTFNEAFKRITAASANTKVPEKEADCWFDTEPLNVSTYCVAMRTAAIYEKYQDTMIFRRSLLFTTENPNLDFEFQKQSELLYDIYDRADAIDKDLKASEEALDTTLAAYKEFQYAYPIHKAYEETFKLLVKYRDFLAEIRAQIEKFPSKFI